MLNARSEGTPGRLGLARGGGLVAETAGRVVLTANLCSCSELPITVGAAQHLFNSELEHGMKLQDSTRHQLNNCITERSDFTLEGVEGIFNAPYGCF